MSLFNVLISNTFVMQIEANKSKSDPMEFFKAVFSVLSEVSVSRRSLITLALFLAIGQLNAQGWVKKFGGPGLDQAEDIQTTKDGGYIVLGFRQTNSGERIYLVRTDIDGEVLWSGNYGTGNVHGYQLVEDQDGSVLVVGDKRASGSDNMFLLKVDQKGRQLWSRELIKPGNQTAQAIIAVSEGGYLVAGQTDAIADGEDDVLLLRLDDSGNEVWSETFGQAKDDRAFGLTQVSDGYVLTGTSERLDADAADNDIILIKVDKTGQLVWENRISTEEAEEAYGVVTTDEDAVVIAGYQGNSSDILVAKYNTLGEEVWKTVFDNNGLGDQASFIRKLDNGDFLITGLTEITESNIDVFIAGIGADGAFKSIETFGPAEAIDQGVALDLTLDGGLIIASTTTPLAAFVEDILIYKTYDGLNTLTNKIEGEVVYLSGGDCATTNTEVEFSHPRWIVVAEQGNRRFFGTTDENGRFEIDVDSGDYQVTAIQTSTLWSLCEDKLITFDRQYDTTIQVVLTTQFNPSAPEQGEGGLADLRIDVATPYVREGGEVVYDVFVFNEGTENSEEVNVEIQLDEELAYVSSKGNGPVTALSDLENGFLVYRITPSEMRRGDFSTFRILARARELGEDMLIRQAISSTGVARSNNNFREGPETDIQVNINTTPEGPADISIRNVGFNPINRPIAGVVIQDDIGFLRGEYTPTQDGLLPGEVVPIDAFNFEGNRTFDEIAPEGQTIRFIATIEGDGLKGLGTKAVEPYGRTEEGNYEVGFFSMFPEDDEYRDTVIDVRETRASVEAIELIGYPNGYRDSVVAANVDLAYTIYFENIGTDTLERVVIRDTLSELLDLTSVLPGASNWPYRFEVDDNGIVKFTFDGVKIYPAGSGAEIDSTYGYVKFVVSQKPDLPAGSVIHNRAAVFFDYREPQLTDFVTHVIGSYPDFIEFEPLTNVDEPFVEGVNVKIYPNPFADGAMIEISGKNFGAVTLRIYDLQGKLVESHQYSGNKFMYYRNRKLPSGTYVYRLESEGQLINNGKLLVR